MDTKKKMAITGAISLTALFALTLPEFPVELEGEFSAACNITTRMNIEYGIDKTGEVIGKFTNVREDPHYSCRDGLKAFYFKTNDAQYYVSLDKPLPQTKGDVRFERGNRAKIKFSSTLADKAANAFNKFLVKQNSNHEFIVIETYGAKKFEIPAEAITVLKPQ